jgi:glycosyltransferase involved in cell wall biosynthesis
MATVSVILPTYNRLGLLRQAVESVLHQSYEDWELIVADDGSTDGTREYLDGMRDPRVRSIALEHTGNRSRVRNAAIALARGEWIAFLDSDDLWLPDKLRRQLEQIGANPTSTWSCTDVAFIDAHGEGVARPDGKSYRAHSGWILEHLLTFAASATTPTLLVHQSLLREIGGFDEQLLLREDYDLVLRLAARGEIHAMTDVLTLVRQHPDRTSSRRRVAELHRGTEIVFRKAARAATSDDIRAICRRQSAMQLVYQGKALSAEGEHHSALASIARAAGDAPFSREVWRAGIGCVLHAFGWRRGQG